MFRGFLHFPRKMMEIFLLARPFLLFRLPELWYNVGDFWRELNQLTRKWLALLAAGCLTLTACDLLPEEETFQTAPLIRDYQRAEFQQEACTRGDMLLTRSISCSYVPVRTESLSFSIGGIPYDEIFVQPGDAVQAGQLLASLQQEEIVQNVAAAQRQIRKLQLQILHLEQNRALALKAQALSGENSQQALERTNARYDVQKQSLEDALYLAGLRLESYNRQLDERSLRAPMDGTVTYARRISPGDVSAVGITVVTVADSTMSLFRASTELWEHFSSGETVTITSAKTEYQAVVMTEAELGLPESNHVPGEKAFVYFALTEPAFGLEDNDRGTFTLVLDRRENVLRVSSKAISTINGKTVVYYQDENCIKSYKNVTTGLEAEGMTDILSGLEEGELVIVN